MQLLVVTELLCCRSLSVQVKIVLTGGLHNPTTTLISHFFMQVFLHKRKWRYHYQYQWTALIIALE